MKIEQAKSKYRTDRPIPKRPHRDLREDVIYTRAGIVDMTRRKSKRYGSQVERILMRL